MAHNHINAAVLAAVLAAVRRDKYSDSFWRSGSGHYRGGLFVSGLTRELARCGGMSGPILPESRNDLFYSFNAELFRSILHIPPIA